MEVEILQYRGSCPLPPPLDSPNYFNFMQFWGKIWQNRMLLPPPRRVAPPPQGNPGTATAIFTCKEPTEIIEDLVVTDPGFPVGKENGIEKRCWG